MTPDTITYEFPTEPGWWVKWHHREYWCRLSGMAAVFVEQILADGDVLIQIEEPVLA